MEADSSREPYYKTLIRRGYTYLTCSEKHYIFEKERVVVKIAKSEYNNSETDESYYIEKAALDCLSLHGLPVAKVHKIYAKGELLDDFTVLEEEKVNGVVYYKKDSKEDILRQALNLMTEATKIAGSKFGLMDQDGEAKYSSWQEFLLEVVEKMPQDERRLCVQKIESMPKPEKPSFVFTDCNMGNFIFRGKRLEKAIDVERPLWGDKLFLYGVIKSRNPYMYRMAPEREESEIIRFYAKIYPYIFK